MNKFIRACVIFLLFLQMQLSNTGEVEDLTGSFCCSNLDNQEEEFFFKKQGSLDKSIIDMEKKFIFSLESHSSIRIFSRFCKVLLTVDLPNKNCAISRFCVSPDNLKLLYLVSNISDGEEANQDGIGIVSLDQFNSNNLLNEVKLNYFCFDKFLGLQKRFIRVNGEDLHKKIQEGYEEWYTHYDFKNNKLEYGLRNLFSDVAIDNTGTKVALSNNNALYLLELSKLKAHYMRDLPVEPIDNEWPVAVEDLGFNEKSDGFMALYNNRTADQFLISKRREAK